MRTSQLAGAATLLGLPASRHERRKAVDNVLGGRLDLIRNYRETDVPIHF
jgi:hypothetical protein